MARQNVALSGVNGRIGCIASISKGRLCILALSLLFATVIAALDSRSASAAGINGRVCNSSSFTIALTVTVRGQFRLGLLPSGYCTKLETVDVEAIWGRSCRNGSCYYQLWKVGNGYFWVTNELISPVPSVPSKLKINGAGAGSEWLNYIPPEWSNTRPSGSQIPYTFTSR